MINQSPGVTIFGATGGGGGGSTTAGLNFTINGGGTALTAGLPGIGFQVPYACTITGWTLLADQTGSVVIDIWKDTYANYPPTVADTITGSAKPTISASNKATSTTLTGWTTSIAAGDVLFFNVDSAATITQLSILLTVTK
jgi:hypothetical protein